MHLWRRGLVVALISLVAMVTAVAWVSAGSSVGRQTPSTSFGSRALLVHLKIKAQDGPIPGSVDLDVCNPCMAVESFTHEVKTAREAGSGLATGREAGSGMATGKRQHQPLVIRKRIDKATPLLYKALSTGETLPNVTLQVSQVSADGDVSPYFTYDLSEAIITGISVAMGDDGLPMEEVSFQFEKITYTHVPSKTTAEDSWTTQR